MVYLLSVSNDGIAIVQAQEEELSKQINKILSEEKEKQKLNSVIAKMGTTALEQLRATSRTKSRLLNPKRQVIRIFGVFLGSLACLMAYHLCKDPYFSNYNHVYDFAWVVASLILFFYGLWILRQIAWVSIDTKNDIERQAKAKERPSSDSPDEDIISPEAK